jgi:ATP-dependent Clp protease ATP-binding subunit ClpB
LDNIVVFKSLGKEELRRIVDIELETVQERIRLATPNKPFVVNVGSSAKEFLLSEGTDLRYGARPLKRAIERLLVQPLSNLIATGQIHGGDCIRVSHNENSPFLVFYCEAQEWGTAGRAAA